MSQLVLANVPSSGLPIIDSVEVLEVLQVAQTAQGRCLDPCYFSGMRKELIVRVLAIGAGVFTVSAAAILIFGV